MCFLNRHNERGKCLDEKNGFKKQSNMDDHVSYFSWFDS